MSTTGDQKATYNCFTGPQMIFCSCRSTFTPKARKRPNELTKHLIGNFGTSHCHIVPHQKVTHNMAVSVRQTHKLFGQIKYDLSSDDGRPSAFGRGFSDCISGSFTLIVSHPPETSSFHREIKKDLSWQATPEPARRSTQKQSSTGGGESLQRGQLIFSTGGCRPQRGVTSSTWGVTISTSGRTQTHMI